MNLGSSTSPDNFKDFVLPGYDEFSPKEAADARQIALDRYFCQRINGSCVIAVPGPANVGFVVGVLGNWFGTLNVPAATEAFPTNGDHDLEHVIALHDGEMSRMSYRQLAVDACGIGYNIR